MCQEQQNLSENFSAFSNFLFNELGASADYRLAVTNMDTDEGKARGRFLVDPAAPAVAQGCPTTDGVGFVPNTADCQALVDSGALKPVLRGEEIESQQQLEQVFRCMATLGTGGSGVERGLEAMRLALSCNGPNAAQFGGCCIDDPEQPNTGRKVYNPSCSPEVMGFAEPEFLRPDALLVVIFVSDENDCSSPSDNPQASTRPICKYNIVDQDGDGVPDGYNDRTLCEGLGPAACYARLRAVRADSNVATIVAVLLLIRTLTIARITQFTHGCSRLCAFSRKPQSEPVGTAGCGDHCRTACVYGGR